MPYKDPEKKLLSFRRVLMPMYDMSQARYTKCPCNGWNSVCTLICLDRIDFLMAKHAAFAINATCCK